MVRRRATSAGPEVVVGLLKSSSRHGGPFSCAGNRLTSPDSLHPLWLRVKLSIARRVQAYPGWTMNFQLVIRGGRFHCCGSAAAMATAN
jgi:hypothetical protein